MSAVSPASDVPVLLLAFRRADACARVLEALREARCRRLFFAVDGPRPGRADDAAACAAVRALADRIDWPCELRTRFLEANRGCRRAPAEAITWFFGQVGAGVVLEEDCLPTASFLPFCAELLARYRDDARVGLITGNNHYGFQTDPACSYHFSRHSGIWGWASWARAWTLYDGTLDRYRPEFAAIRRRLSPSTRFRAYWWRMVEQVESGLDTWDVQWDVARYAHGLLTVRPPHNLVANIGFGDGSTHTLRDFRERYYAAARDLAWPLRHPDAVAPDTRADRRWERRVLSLRDRARVWLDARLAGGWPRQAGEGQT